MGESLHIVRRLPDAYAAPRRVVASFPHPPFEVVLCVKTVAEGERELRNLFP